LHGTDVISLKPNVISAVYMGNGVLLVVVLRVMVVVLYIFYPLKVSESKINLWVTILTINGILPGLSFFF
jgi:hypothetical protein